jgi:hypothetical protein
MSFEPDFIWYPSSKRTDAMKADLFFTPDPFFAPDPQLADAPSPETFDLEVDNDKEVEEFDLDLSFKQFDDFFATIRATIPVVPTPSAVTHSTESIYEGSSQYSSGLTLSDYSIPSEIESRGSVNDGLYNTHASVYSAAFSDTPSSFPPPSPANAVAVQEYTTFALSAPVHMVPDEAHGPAKPFKCLLCPFCESAVRDFVIGSLYSLASKRKHNLKTHVEATHNKSKPFECSSCWHQFSRKHDLRRHRASKHGSGKLSSSSSVSSISKRSFDPIPGLPDLFHHCTTLNGDPTPMSPACPDQFLNFDAIDVPENIIAWLQGV